MAAETKNTKQVMDVAKPGKTPAEATARPIIVGHKPEVQDPMVTSAEDKNPEVEATTPAEPTLNPTGKKVIAPLTTETPEPEPEEKKPDEAKEPETQPETEPDEPKLLPDEDKTAEGDEGIKNEEQDVLKKQQERIDTLVAQKKYFVPIGSVRRRKSRMTALLVLFIIVGLLGIAVIAIDAEIVDVGFTLPFKIMPE